MYPSKDISAVKESALTGHHFLIHFAYRVGGVAENSKSIYNLPSQSGNTVSLLPNQNLANTSLHLTTPSLACQRGAPIGHNTAQ